MPKYTVLVLDPEYYLQNANTSIVDRISKQLSEKYTVIVATFSPIHSRKYELSSNMQIISIPYYSMNKKMNSAKTSMAERIRIVYFSIKAKLTMNDLEEKNCYYFVREFLARYNMPSFDVIISFSNPFVSHLTASIISKRTNTPWIAYYFDPFFSNMTLSLAHIDKRKSKEEKILSRADRIMMTYPTNKDYFERNIAFKNAIIKTEMPGIRDGIKAPVLKNTEDGRVRCSFIGNIYEDIRNPMETIKLFGELSDIVELIFVGGRYGNTAEEYRLPKNVKFIGKRTGDELLVEYRKADFFVNIGNSITNQMPSKIFEYINTGKPIINIYKKANCPTLKYTSKYSLAINIFEEDIECDIDAVKQRILTFIRKNRGAKISETSILQEFKDNTDQEVVAALDKQIKELIK